MNRDVVCCIFSKSKNICVLAGCNHLWQMIQFAKTLQYEIEKENMTPDTFIRPAANRPLI